MANNIGLVAKFSADYLDEIFRLNSVTAILQRNNKGFSFVNAHTVKIPKILLSGLEDYNRSDMQDPSKHYKGYAQGDAGVEWETFELTQDRGKQFRIDTMDNEESMNIVLGNLLDQFTRKQIIPEVDAYNISKIISYALPEYRVSKNYTADTNAQGVLTDMVNARALLADEEVPEGSVVMLCSNTFYAYLQTTPELTRYITQSDFTGNDGIFTKVTQFNGMPIIPVPKRRFISAIETAGKTGYTAASGAVEVNFVLVSIDSVIPVKKHEFSKLFGPDVVQDFDGSKLNYRLYYDLFVPANKTYGIYVSLGSTSATDVGRTIATTYVDDTTGGTITFSKIDTRGIAYTSFKIGATNVALDGNASALDAVTLNTAYDYGVNTTLYVYGVDANGKVLSKTVAITVGS